MCRCVAALRCRARLIVLKCNHHGTRSADCAAMPPADIAAAQRSCIALQGGEGEKPGVALPAPPLTGARVTLVQP